MVELKNNRKYILLFDGVCNLCNSSVQFIIKRDQTQKFKFASLQSEIGQSLLKKFNLPQDDFNSFVLLGENCYFTKSKAVLKVLRELGGLWKLLYVFIILPRPIRDFCYTAIANSRYKIFGKRDSCMVPTPDILQRFLK